VGVSEMGDTSIYDGFKEKHDDSPGDLMAYFQTKSIGLQTQH